MMTRRKSILIGLTISLIFALALLVLLSNATPKRAYASPLPPDQLRQLSGGWVAVNNSMQAGLGAGHVYIDESDNQFTITTTEYRAVMLFRNASLTPNTYFRWSFDMFSTKTNIFVFGVLIGDRHYIARAVSSDDWGRLEIVFNSGDGTVPVQKIKWFGAPQPDGFAKGISYIRNIQLERLDQTTDNEWRILGVIAHNLDVDFEVDGEQRNLQISLDQNDVAIARQNFYDLENSLNTMSNGQMQASVEILEIFTPLTGIVHMPMANGVFSNMINPNQIWMLLMRYVDIRDYDHIMVFMRTGRGIDINNRIPNVHWAGLYVPSVPGFSMSYVRFSYDSPCYWHTAGIFPDRVLVHEFIHALEWRSMRRGIEIPRGTTGWGIDHPYIYWNYPVGMDFRLNALNFYTAVMNRQIPHPIHGHMIGFTEQTYLNQRFTRHSIVHQFMGAPIQLRAVALTRDENIVSWYRNTNFGRGYHVYANGQRITTEPLTTRRIDLDELDLDWGVDHLIQVRSITDFEFRADSELSEGIAVRFYYPISGIQILGGGLIVGLNTADFMLEYAILPSPYAPQYTLLWASSNPEIISINSATGMVSVVGLGTAIISLYIEGTGFGYYISIIVRNNITGISINQVNLEVYFGDISLGLTYTINPVGEVVPYTLVWTSSNENVAGVLEGGIVIFAGVGTAVITVKVYGTDIYDEITVTVSERSGCGCGMINSRASFGAGLALFVLLVLSMFMTVMIYRRKAVRQ